MSILTPHELLLKISRDSRETSKPSPVPERKFKELLHVRPAEENRREKDFFSLIEEEEEKEAIVAACPPPSPLNLSPLSLNEDNELAEAPYSIALTAAAAESRRSAMAAQSVLSAEIEAIFEKLAACMIVMNSSGETETTLFLDNPNSLFFGTRVTIREFSTAPKAFNIEIISSSQAIHALESSKNGLLSAFQKGNFNFSVHRLDTYLQDEERPVLHRKENTERDNQQQGGRE